MAHHKVGDRISKRPDERYDIQQISGERETVRPVRRLEEAHQIARENLVDGDLRRRHDDPRRRG